MRQSACPWGVADLVQYGQCHIVGRILNRMRFAYLGCAECPYCPFAIMAEEPEAAVRELKEDSLAITVRGLTIARDAALQEGNLPEAGKLTQKLLNLDTAE